MPSTKKQKAKEKKSEVDLMPTGLQESIKMLGEDFRSFLESNKRGSGEIIVETDKQIQSS